jgi:integrase
MLYKRRRPDGSLGKTWWTRFTIGGIEVKQSCKTDRKALAEEFERQLREELWREIELGEVRHSWEEAKEQWLKDKAHKRSISRDQEAFDALDKILAGMALVDIDEGVLLQCEEHLAPGRERSTVLRLMAVLRGVLRRAEAKWKWIPKAPAFMLEKPPKKPRRWERPEAIATLRKELKPHVLAIVNFALAVGPRSGNIFNLKWTQLDLAQGWWFVEVDDFKGKRTVGFPLSPQAIEILKGQIGKHAVYVFPDHLGRAPMGSIKTSWKQACKRAGLEGLRVHDLRHTWVAWHKLKGTPDRAIKELGGWASMAMVEEYGHINPQDYSQYADNSPTKSGTQDVKESEISREK